MNLQNFNFKHDLSRLLTIPVVALLLSLSGCNNEASDSETPVANDSAVVTATAAPSEPESQLVSAAGQTEFVPMADRDSIPYPLYPNGSQYRIGGENGLKIVVFETSDGFETVDAYFQQALTQKPALARQVLMPDFVKYSSRQDSKEELWQHDAPGIVIHRFADASEASTVGAAPGSQTNIIMSFR